MSDFDLSLIREFRNRPAFYDRNSPLFKDKVFNAQAWQEISNILGYDVALLKDRMLQLRNRYNLEKRRLEQLSEENPGKYVQSPWPLYEHLGFLSEHIRSRRSFKRMMPRQSSTDLNMTRGNDMSPTASESAYAAAPLADGMLTVKLENASEGESDSQSGETGARVEDDQEKINELINDKDAAAGAAVLTNLRNYRTNNNITNHNNIATSHQHQAQASSHRQSLINIRNLDSMRPSIPKHRKICGRSENNRRNSVAREELGDAMTIIGVPDKKRFVGTREQKYEAFGNFVASSLEEMPRQTALKLVERFTAEVVRILIEKNLTESKKTGSSRANLGANFEDGSNKTHTAIAQTHQTTPIATCSANNGAVGGGNRLDDSYQKNHHQQQQQQQYQQRS